MFNEAELQFQCPYCAQWISFLVEELYGSQQYIEDCEVCCQPILIRYQVQEGQVSLQQAERAD